MLEKLRLKPKEVKNRYAFGGAALLTGVIALVWLASLQTRLIDQGDVLTTEPEVRGVFSGFFEQVRSNAANTISSFRKVPGDAEVDNIKELESEVDKEGTASNHPDETGPVFSWSSSTPTTTDSRRVILIATSSNTEIGD